jgi:hypothetical protein
MKQLNQNLSEALGIEPLQENTEVKLPVILNNDVEDDVEYARKNIKSIIEKGNDAVDNILKVAVESEHPRAFEVASTFLKNLSEMNKDLLDLQKSKKALLQQSSTKQTLNVDKAVFVGTTADLLKMQKQENND